MKHNVDNITEGSSVLVAVGHSGRVRENPSKGMEVLFFQAPRILEIGIPGTHAFLVVCSFILRVWPLLPRLQNGCWSCGPDI